MLTVDPEGQVPAQLLGAAQYFGIVIEAQFVFEGGEEALHYRVFPAAAGKPSPGNGSPDQFRSGAGPIRSGATLVPS